MKNVEVCFNNDEFNETCATVSNLQRLGDETVSLDVFEETNVTYTYDVTINHVTQDDLSDSSSGTVTVAATPTGEPAEDGSDDGGNDNEDDGSTVQTLEANLTVQSNDDLTNLTEGDSFNVSELVLKNNGDQDLNVSITQVSGGYTTDVPLYIMLNATDGEREIDLTSLQGDSQYSVNDVNFTEGNATMSSGWNFDLGSNGGSYLEFDAYAVNSDVSATSNRVDLNFTEPSTSDGSSDTAGISASISGGILVQTGDTASYSTEVSNVAEGSEVNLDYTFYVGGEQLGQDSLSYSYGNPQPEASYTWENSGEGTAEVEASAEGTTASDSISVTIEEPATEPR
jgi:hypothetical protein